MTKAGRFAPSSVRYLNWGIMSNGKCLTARISESLKQESGCILSDILILSLIHIYRSSQPTFEEFARVVADTRLGGVLSGKAGIVNVHLGAVSYTHLDVYKRQDQSILGIEQHRTGKTGGSDHYVAEQCKHMSSYF